MVGTGEGDGFGFKFPEDRPEAFGGQKGIAGFLNFHFGEAEADADLQVGSEKGDSVFADLEFNAGEGRFRTAVRNYARGNLDAMGQCGAVANGFHGKGLLFLSCSSVCSDYLFCYRIGCKELSFILWLVKSPFLLSG